ncbi:beta-N-acetylhexosaminidase [uncultured Clostridium sp.]|uniref:beta-N-acetylhexosaminidase n=1 Tax=uncultured Clostridium sp. TaxID=59620 RepID=UPI0028E5BCD8|nr:beta-N-acetylhexosaminidase [uncultured Clostridium sp.]
MFKKITVLILILCTMFLGCGRQEESKIKEIEDKPIVPTIDPIKEEIKNLTLEEKIGQMFIMKIEGQEVNENTVKLITEDKIGGVILFQNNIKDSSQLVKLINSIKKYNVENPIPLFISIDEEGGRVTRMPKEVRKLPSSRQIGRAGSKDVAYNVGLTVGEELRNFGINMNFAPVMDINNNPANKVIGDRAFGDNPQTVSELGIEVMKGLKNAEVIPALKHFPGHGDTSVDSHEDLPIINKDIESLEKFEMLPFKKGIEEGADVIMIAHILLPQLDKENPSTLSPVIIKDILREKFGFQGVVITDDISMKAISNKYGVGESALKALKAGSDIVLSCYTPDKQEEMINFIKKSVKDGTLSEEEIDEKLYRILKLKNKYYIDDEAMEMVNINIINENIDKVLKDINKNIK